MTEVIPLVGGAVASFGFGSVAGSFQHFLYREAEYRNAPATGRALTLIRWGLGIAAAIVVALALRPGHYDLGPGVLTGLFGVVLLVIASTDFERRRIPNRITYPATAAAIAFCWAWPDRDPESIMQGAAFAAGLGAVLFGAGIFVGGAAGGLGLGDVKLMILLGLLVGWPGAMYALFIGMILAGIPGVVLLAKGRRKAHFSYGPYLVGGGLAVLLFPAAFG